VRQALQDLGRDEKRMMAEFVVVAKPYFRHTGESFPSCVSFLLLDSLEKILSIAAKPSEIEMMLIFFAFSMRRSG
jgi:hypothetical protein